MKKVLLIVFATVLCSAAFYSNAQTTDKFGHIDFDALLAAMPEFDSAQTNIQKQLSEYQTNLEEMEVELNNKYEEYLTNREAYSAIIRQTKETEIQDLQTRIQQFQLTADQDIQEFRKRLLTPIIQKANKTIADVARENNFSYIFNSATLLYFADDTEDIMGLVKAKLNLE